MHHPLFAFGTLMDKDVLVNVCGMPLSELERHPAVVSGFERRRVRGESFPVLVAAEHGKVSGSLIYGLHPRALQRVQFFEGEEYCLRPVTAHALPGSHSTQMPSGGVISQFFADNQVYDVDEHDWSMADWREREKPEFMVRLARYMAHFGTLSAAEADRHW